MNACCWITVTLNYFSFLVMSQFQSSQHTMPKKGKNKDKVTGEDSNMGILPRMGTIYEDMKAVTRIEPEFRWGQIYQIMKDQTVPYAGFEDIPLYVNISKSSITKVATHPKIFPCAEVIGWILPRANTSTMIISNTKGQEFSSFTPAYINKACKLLAPQIMMTYEWINNLIIDLFECTKRMMVAGKQLLQKSSGEYETTNFCTPYRLIALMLNIIFGREKGKFYKMSWIPLIYHVAMQGTIFN